MIYSNRKVSANQLRVVYNRLVRESTTLADKNKNLSLTKKREAERLRVQLGRNFYSF